MFSNKKSIALKAIIVAFLAVFSQSCFQSKPKIIDVNPAFGAYIAGYTSGMVTRKTTIKVVLVNSPIKRKELIQDSVVSVNTSFAGTEAPAKNIEPAIVLPDSTLLEDIFEFEPEIKGRAVWIDDRTIEFIPNEVLPSKAFYSVDFNLKQVDPSVKSEFKHFKFQFSTYEQNLFVNTNFGLQSYDEFNIEWQSFRGEVTLSDYEDTSLLKKTITANCNGKNLNVQWDYSYNNNSYNFTIDSIKRTENPGALTIAWNGDAIHAAQKGSQMIAVPALGDFNVTSANVEEEANQSVQINFSDPILVNQNFNGIISIDGVDKLTYSVDKNTVNVYLPKRIVGVKELKVTTGVKNFRGFKMNKAYNQTLVFNEPKPQIHIVGKGNILPKSQGLIFPFEAISLNAVDVRVIKIYGNNVHQFLQINNFDETDGLTRVGKIIAEKKIKLDYDKKKNLKEWNTHIIDLAKLIKPEEGAIYRVSIKFEKEYALCDCDTSADENNNDGEYYEYNSSNYDPNWSEEDWWGYGFGGYEDYDYYDEKYNVCDRSYYYGKAQSRNIIASDLGLIYKLDENKTSHAFISNLITAQPIAGAKVEYFDYVKQIIASGTTDANGMLDVKLSRKPFLMVAKKDNQVGYLKLRDGYSNSLSKFDIEGEYVEKGVKGFLYAERGVWRPGDSIYVNFILEDKLKTLPKNYPVKFELQSPSGTVIYQTTKSTNVNGTYDFRTATGIDAETGNYLAIARVGNRDYTQRIKVETIKPNRLKIYFDFKDNFLTESKVDSGAKLSVKWLHGAVAKNLKAQVDVKLSQTETKFDKYPSYIFDSPLRTYYTDASVIFDGNLNEKGEAEIPTNLSVGTAAPGMLRATYITKVFEDGGDFSIDRNTIKYSPYKNYVGLDAPHSKNYDYSLETGNTHQFDLVCLNQNGALNDKVELNVKVYKLGWQWWYEKGDEELSAYLSRSSALVVKDTILNTTKGRAKFNFRVNYPEYGRYLMVATDVKGGHQTGKIVYIDWPYWSRANRSDNENATMLNFTSDKEKYTRGENIKLSIPSPANGKALVSIENGQRVVQKFWISTTKGETKYEFPATAEMAPNAYIHVTMLQPHLATQNDLPIRMYGIVPITVDDPETHLYPMITMADVIKPESVANIMIKEKTGKAMTYTLAVVDEGLLDLTRFQTPQPHTTFYAKQALGVQTWDMYDFVIGAYAGKLDKLISIGGDGDAGGAKGTRANRFKPMVKFIGPFTLAAGQQRNHKIEIPNYVGSVKVMVVAQNNGSYGNGEKIVAVRKPLMLLATLPRVLGPGETVSLPVDVFAMEKKIENVKVSVTVNDLLVLDGNAEQKMQFKSIGDEVINFKLKVAQKIGLAKVKVTATCGNEIATQEIELDVRASNPLVLSTQDLVLEANQTLDASVLFKGLEGTNKTTIEVSNIPSMGLQTRLDYLIQYPHGCVEQTTSAVFPQLYVGNMMELKDKQKENISKNIKAAIKRLVHFQTSNGGFSYWPGENYESDWGTNYAGHFLIEAEKLGYSLPLNMKTKWINYQKNAAKNWTINKNYYSSWHSDETQQNIQAYRLFVLANCNQPELGAMNRLREETNLSHTAQWRLAAAYYLIGQTEVANKMIATLPIEVKKYNELSYSYGSDFRDEAMILEALSIMKERSKAKDLAKKITNSLNGNTWYSTQETAYSLLALCEYYDVKSVSPEFNFSYKLSSDKVKNSDENKVKTKKRINQFIFDESDITKTGNVNLKNLGSTALYMKIMTEGVPLVGDKTERSNGLKLSVIYKDGKGKVINPSRIAQGSDFYAEVTVNNLSKKGLLKELTLNQIFASGWEIHNTRMDGTDVGKNAFRHQDIRDDRVYTYYDITDNESKTFTIQLNATYLGKFYLPSIYTEAMYDKTVSALLPGQWVEVVKEDLIGKK